MSRIFSCPGRSSPPRESLPTACSCKSSFRISATKAAGLAPLTQLLVKARQRAVLASDHRQGRQVQGPAHRPASTTDGPVAPLPDSRCGKSDWGFEDNRKTLRQAWEMVVHSARLCAVRAPCAMPFIQPVEFRHPLVDQLTPSPQQVLQFGPLRIRFALGGVRQGKDLAEPGQDLGVSCFVPQAETLPDGWS